MSQKQHLIETYETIEQKRKDLKAMCCVMVNNNADSKQIKEIRQKLNALTLNQAWIMVDLEKCP